MTSRFSKPLLLSLIALLSVALAFAWVRHEERRAAARREIGQLEASVRKERAGQAGLDRGKIEGEIAALRKRVENFRSGWIDAQETSRRSERWAAFWQVECVRVIELPEYRRCEYRLSLVSRAVAEWPSIAREIGNLSLQEGNRIVSVDVEAAGDAGSRHLERVEVGMLLFERREKGEPRG